MQKGYFFCGDLLGFANITKNLNSDELTHKMDQWVSIVKTCARNSGIKKYQLISDTIFAATNDDIAELSKLVNFAEGLLNTCILQSLLIRGAIVHGDFVFNDAFVYGNAVIRAHILEQQQQWIGVMIDDSSDSLTLQNYIDMHLICYPVPMHSADVRLYPAIHWKIPQYEDLSTYSTTGGLTYIGETLNWRWGTKIQNTILFNLYAKFIQDNKIPPNIFKGGFNIHWLDVMMNNPIYQT